LVKCRNVGGYHARRQQLSLGSDVRRNFEARPFSRFTDLVSFGRVFGQNMVKLCGVHGIGDSTEIGVHVHTPVKLGFVPAVRNRELDVGYDVYKTQLECVVTDRGRGGIYFEYLTRGSDFEMKVNPSADPSEAPRALLDAL
jgi:hypothetical protein